MKKIIFVFLGVLLFAYSCTKEEDKITENINNKGVRNFLSVDDPITYCKKNLTIIAKGLSAMSNDQDFIDILHNKVDEQFDGDYNVLFNDLVTACNNNNIDLIYQMKNYLNSNGLDSSDLTSALTAFDNIDSNTYYIQVYIPNFEDKSEFNSTSPNSLAFYGDETKLTYDGYYSSNDILYTSTGIDEDYSEASEVWVVSINENVDNDGELITPIDPLTKEFLVSEIPSPTLHGNSTINMLLYSMKVKERKESWCGGKSEISLISGDTYHNGNDLDGNPYLDKLDGDNARGRLLCNFTKREIADGDVKLIYAGSHLVENWDNTNYYNQTVVYCYTLFERDVWPVSRRYTNLIPIVNFKYRIRSADDEYVVSALSSMDSYNDFPYFDSYTMDNSGIKVQFLEY